MHKTRGFVVATLSALEAQNAICREQEDLRGRISKAAEKGTSAADDAIISMIRKVLQLGESLERISSNKTYAIIEVTPIGGEDGE